MARFQPTPLVFEPLLETRVWGGRALADMGKRLAGTEPVGESWEISDVEGKSGLVASGPHTGRSLRALVERWPDEILGAGGADTDGRFPLLVKLLDAREDLSLQVHPADEDLRRLALPGAGKTEAWIILAAEPGARVIHGIPAGTTLPAFYDVVERFADRRVDAAAERDCLRWVEVAPGDVVFVPARTLHALGAGVVLLEVQQTSDITYRVHDWGRLGLDGQPRDLHLPEARRLAAAPEVPCPLTRVDEAEPATGVATLLECDKFVIERVSPVGGAAVELTTAAGGAPRFCIIAGYRGSWALHGGGEVLPLERGTTLLLPAALGDYRLEPTAPDACCLRVSVP